MFQDPNPYVKSLFLQNVVNGNLSANIGDEEYSNVLSADPSARQGSATAVMIGRSLFVIGPGGFYAPPPDA